MFRTCGGDRGLTKSIVLDGYEFHGLYRTEVLWEMVQEKLCKSGENNSLIEEKMPVDIWSSQLIHDTIRERSKGHFHESLSGLFFCS